MTRVRRNPESLILPGATETVQVVPYWLPCWTSTWGSLAFGTNALVYIFVWDHRLEDSYEHVLVLCTFTTMCAQEFLGIVIVFMERVEFCNHVTCVGNRWGNQPLFGNLWAVLYRFRIITKIQNTFTHVHVSFGMDRSKDEYSVICQLVFRATRLENCIRRIFRSSSTGVHHWSAVALGLWCSARVVLFSVSPALLAPPVN